MGIVKEFREFAVKGNVVDLAVGVIIGAAFGKIVTSLTDDLFMPILGRLTGGLNFTDYFINLTPDKAAVSLADAKKAGAAVIAYGSFLNTVLNFVIVGFAMFILVKGMNRLRRTGEAGQPAPPPADPVPTKEELLLTEIRDLLAHSSTKTTGTP